MAINGRSGHQLLRIDAASGATASRGLLARLLGAKGPAVSDLPWPKHNLEALWPIGDALVVDAASWEGARRVAILDARTLQVRHDSGPVSRGATPGLRIRGAQLVMSVAGPSDGHEIRAIDPARGVQLWVHRLDHLDDLALRGNSVVMSGGATLDLADPATGQAQLHFAP